MPNIGEFSDAVERASQTADKVVLDIKGVKELTTLGQTTIYEMAKRGDFPKQRRLGSNRVVWLRSEVLEWIDAKLAEAEAA